MYYAYVHARPNTADAQGIFYVGKGKGVRCYYFDRRTQNPHYARVVKKNGTPLVGKFDCSSETIAFDLERGLIKCLRRMGVQLTNLTNGGEGPSGMVHSEASKARIAAKSSSWKRPESLKHKISISQRGERNSAKLPGVGDKIADAMRYRVWVHLGEKSKLVAASESMNLVAEGWGFGRPASSADKSRKSALNNTNTRGTFWINNGVACKRSTLAELDTYSSEGWKRGRLK